MAPVAARCVAGLGLFQALVVEATDWGASLPAACEVSAPRVRLLVDVPAPGEPAKQLSHLVRLSTFLLGGLPVSLSTGKGSVSAHTDSGYVVLHANETQARLEMVTCAAETVRGGPELSWKQVLGVKGLGGTPKWSVSASGLDEDSNLHQYYQMMSHHEENKELVASQNSGIARAAIWRLGDGQRLVLNDVVMSDTRDEHVYHEMLVHPAMLMAQAPRRVLIIGGSEGASLREVLKDPRVEKVTMVDIDQQLVDLCRSHLGAMHQGSFASPKATVLTRDGAAFLREAAASSFDVVVVDGVDYDWEASSNALFEEGFYREVWRVLAGGGVFAQYISDADLIAKPFLRRAGFPESVSLGVDVPSFLGYGALFTLTGKGLPSPLRDYLVRVAAPDASMEHRHMSPEALIRGLAHADRRLKGGGGGGGDDGDGEHSPEMTAAIIAAVFGGLCLLFICFVVLQKYKERLNSEGYEMDPLGNDEE